MANDLRVLCWNIDGVFQRLAELKLYLSTEKIDICLLSETHLTNDKTFKIRGYCVYQTNDPDNKGWGGTAVIINENIKHHEQTKYETVGMQATTICVNTKQDCFDVSAIYCRPRFNLKKDDYLAYLNSLNKRFIIGGDWNAKNTIWGSRITLTKGRELLKACNELNCQFHSTGKPTFWPTDPDKVPDLIDFFITRNISHNYLSIEEDHDLLSDHSAIILTLSDNVIKTESPPVLVNKLTNWEGFKNDLNNKVDLKVKLKTSEDLEKELHQFNTDIQQCAWGNTPLTIKKIKGSNYPKEIKILVEEKRKARRKWQQTRQPSDKTQLNRLTQQLKREILKIKNESFEIFLKGLSSDKNTEYSLWRATKGLKQSKTYNSPIQNSDGNWARSDQEKANLFADHLEEIFKAHAPEIMNDNNQCLFVSGTKYSEQETKGGESHNENNHCSIKPTSPKEVASVIKHCIKKKKSPGFDLITGNILHNLPPKAILKLTYLINAAFRLKYVPSLWKTAEIVMIPKPGKTMIEPTSYRPISMLPILSKVFEKIFLKRINGIIAEKKIIPNHQFGFQRGHSTIDQVHRLTDVIEKTLESKKVCAAVFLDVSQAFDRVWHQGLIKKIRNFLPESHVCIIESYLTDRTFRVKQKSNYSAIKKIGASVPQGSSISPLLYTLYTYDIPQSTETKIFTFADDTAVLAVGENVIEATGRLQANLNKIQEWTIKWKTNLNNSKSVHVNFTNKKEEHLPIYLNQAVIPYANSAKYLGMTLDSKLRWKEHVKKKHEELQIKYRKMYWLLGKSSKLSVYNKLLLYNQVLKPVWTYGIQLWGCTKKSTLKCLQTFQNKVLRSAVNAPWYVRNSDIHRDLKIATVSEEIAKCAKKHEQRLHSHPNVEIIQLLDNGDELRRLKRTKPLDLI